jgi:hypothetical protein
MIPFKEKGGWHFSRDSHQENSRSMECPFFIIWIKEFVMGSG